jgi:Ribonuclease G/E
LLEKWNSIVNAADSANPPTLLYRDQDLLYRVIREACDSNVDEIVVDTAFALHRTTQLLQHWNMQVKVTNKEPLGAETHVFVQVKDANIVAKVSPEVVVQLGDTINFTPDMTRAKFFDLTTEINICEPEIEKKW